MKELNLLWNQNTVLSYYIPTYSSSTQPSTHTDAFYNPWILKVKYFIGISYSEDLGAFIAGSSIVILKKMFTQLVL